MSGLTDEQVRALLRPINPRRVGKDGKGFSHVEAYEMRAHLNRIFGFCRWDAEVTDQQLIFESCTDGDKPRWTVAYRTIVAVTLRDAEGFMLATYTEGAVGDASNQPSRADAHDLALKTSQSQAFKRCCANIGDQGGLSLYNSGSMRPLVGRVLVGMPPDVEQEPAPVDEHVSVVLPEGGPTPVPDQEDKPKVEADPQVQRTADIDRLRTEILKDPPKSRAAYHYARIQADIARLRLLDAEVADENGEVVKLPVLLNTMRAKHVA